MGTPEELAFLLQESGLALVDASDVLHAADPDLADRTPFLPRGTTQADTWVAKHGDPTKSVEAAMKLASMVGLLKSFQFGLPEGAEQYEAHMQFFRRDSQPVKTTGESLPIAICAGVMTELASRVKP